jgi:choline dehydrogenase-like flavoprotein
MAIDRRKPNPARFQKTLALFGFYWRTPEFPYPAGSLQLIGKRLPATVALSFPELRTTEAEALARHSVDWWLLSEDLPERENRLTVSGGGQIRVHWRPTNRAAHAALLQAARRVLAECGFQDFLVQPIGIDGVAHFCGTVRFGDDPATSALDPSCRAWDIENLWVVDASVFPSSAAVNPALTIAALALRAADRLRQQFGIRQPVAETIARLAGCRGDC